MDTLDLIFLSLGLSADAFAVAVTNGMSCRRYGFFKMIFTGFVFGAFQGIMPSLGYTAGNVFISVVEKFGHIIALLLLLFIGIKMIAEVLHNKEQDSHNAGSISAGMIMVQGLAVSIDALAAGVSLSAVGADIVISAAVIAAVAFLCTISGIIIGKKFGGIFSGKAQLAGGAVLIITGIKIFVQHYLQ